MNVRALMAALGVASAAAAQPIPWDQLIEDRFNVAAQRALRAMSESGDPGANADAHAMVAAVKAGQLAGIWDDGGLHAVQVARQVGRQRWEVIPAGSDSAFVGGARPPAILYREGISSQGARVQAALRAAWAQRPQPVVVVPPGGGPPGGGPPPRIPPRRIPPRPRDPRIKAFFARPEKFDSRPEEPTSLVVPRGGNILIHWDVADADRVELLLRTANGRDIPVTLPDGGGVAGGAQRSSRRLVALVDASYRLRVTAGGVRRVSPRPIFVTTFRSTKPVASLKLFATADAIELIDADRFVVHGPRRRSFAGAPFGEATPPNLPAACVLPANQCSGGAKLPRSDVLKARCPGLLAFQDTAEILKDGETKRAKVVALLEKLNGFGADGGCITAGGTERCEPQTPKIPGRHLAYLDAIFASEPDKGAAFALYNDPEKVGSKLCPKGGCRPCTGSSCGLVVRNAWFLLGARGPDFSAPYKSGQVFDNIARHACDPELGPDKKPIKDKDSGHYKKCKNGALKNPFTDRNFAKNFVANFKKGDVAYLYRNGKNHMITMVARGRDEKGDFFFTIDGGQTAQAGSGFADGGCMAVRKRVHHYREVPGGVQFTDDAKDLTWWVDVSEVKFTEPVIDVVRNCKGVEGLPDWDFDQAMTTANTVQNQVPPGSLPAQGSP